MKDENVKPSSESTFQEQFDSYMVALFPDGVGDVQRKETKQAFFSGALVALNLIVKASELRSDEDSVAAVKRVAFDVLEFCESILAEHRRRN